MGAFVQTKLKIKQEMINLSMTQIKHRKMRKKREMLLNNYLGPCMPKYETKKKQHCNS